MEVVASVIQNRVNHPCDTWGSGWVGVCLHWRQFSCWNSDDPNCRWIESVTEADAEFRLALRLAGETLQGKLTDITSDANYYLTAGARRLPFLRRARFLGRMHGFDCYRMEYR
jgi:N-acetylmuramoyl-L-alanine amidase